MSMSTLTLSKPYQHLTGSEQRFSNLQSSHSSPNKTRKFSRNSKQSVPAVRRVSNYRTYPEWEKKHLFCQMEGSRVSYQELYCWCVCVWAGVCMCVCGRVRLSAVCSVLIAFPAEQLITRLFCDQSEKSGMPKHRPSA